MQLEPQKPSDARTEFAQALYRGDYTKADEILYHGFDVNGESFMGTLLEYELHHLPLEKQVLVAEFLLKRGASIQSSKSSDGGKLLEHAIFNENTELIRIFLDAGANPNALWEPDETIYGCAEWNYRYEVYGVEGVVTYPEEPTQEERKDEDKWLCFMERMAVEYRLRAPDYVRVLRDRGGRTFKELYGEDTPS